MWLRVGKRQRWKDGDVTKAAEDLVPREDEDLSVYLVKDADDGKAVAAMYSVIYRAGPDSIDYVLIPDDAFSGAALAPKKSSDPDAPKRLDDLHYEVPGLGDAGKRATVASLAIKESAPAVRLSQNEIVAIIGAMNVDEEFDGKIQERWRPRLEGLKARS